jgi:histidinol-phosphate aminotransferase
MSQYQICKEIENYESAIKLDLNEFDFAHHPDVYKYICDSVIKPKSITHYSNVYNTNTNTLINHLCQYNNINSNQILLSAGSDDSLEYLIERYINSNTHVLVFAPSYSYFECVIKRHTPNIHYIPLDFNNHDDLDIDNCLEFYKEYLDNAVVYIVNPNNPLGTLISKSSIERMIKKYLNTTFIIDEAYIEFIFGKTSVQLIHENNNIIITRTFSKAYGLAGIRLGYMMAHEKTIDYIKVLYNEKNVTDLAKAAGIAIYNNIGYYENIIEEICDIRRYFQDVLKRLNIFHVPSQSNFVSFYVGENVYQFLQLLEHNSIYIRNRDTQIDMSGFVRITIGTKQHISRVCDIIEQNVDMFDTNPLVKHYISKKDAWKLKLLLKHVIDMLNASSIMYSVDGLNKRKGINPWARCIDIAITTSDKQALVDIISNNCVKLILQDNKIMLNSEDQVFINLVDLVDYNSVKLESIKMYNILDVFISQDMNFDDTTCDTICIDEHEYNIKNAFHS